MSKPKFEDRSDIEIKEPKIELVTVPYDIKPNKRKHVRFTKVRQQAFLANYMKSHNFSKSAYLAGVSRNTVVRQLEINEPLKKAYQEIEEMHLDRYEEVLHNLADKEQSISITPAIFNLKSKRREIYGDKAELEITNVITENNCIQEIRRILAKTGLDRIEEETKGR
jgi:phage terminase small subunit